MFDFDIGKLMVFGIVALAVIPPKDLPRVLRTVGKYVGQMRRMASEFQGQFMEAIKEADVESVKKELESIGASAKIDSSFDPAMAMRDEIHRAAESAGPAPIEAREPFMSEIVANPLKAPEPEALPKPEAARPASESGSPAPSHAQ
jgi:sec-independent protein translocase protein TatB